MRERKRSPLLSPLWVAGYAALMGVAWVAHEGLSALPWALVIFALQAGLDWLSVEGRAPLPLRGALVVVFSLVWVAASGWGRSPLWPGLVVVSGVLGSGVRRRRWASWCAGAVVLGYLAVGLCTVAQPGSPGAGEILSRAGLILFGALIGGQIGGRLLGQRERAEASERRLRALLQAAQGITRELDVEATLRSILDRAAELLQVEKAAILMEEPETGELRVAAARGVSPSDWPRFSLARRGPLATEVMEHGRPRIVSGEAADEEGREFDELGMREVAIVPLSVGEEKMGMLVVSDGRGRRLSEEDLEILRLFGTFAAVAIYKARAHRRTERALERSEERASRLGMIADLGRRLSLAMTVEELVKVALDGICEELGYEGAAVLLPQAGEPRRLKVAGARGLLEGLKGEAKVDLSSPSIGRELSEGRPVLIEDVEHLADPEARFLHKSLGARSLLIVPLTPHGRVAGALELASSKPRAFGEEQMAEASLLASFLAAGLEDVELHVELERRARELERANEELRRSQEQLVRAARLATIGELAAIVAHELNNPLTAVLGYSQLAMMQVEDGSPLKEDLKVVEKEALRAKEIVRRLLDFAKEVRPKAVEFDLNEVVKDSVKMLAYELQASNIEVRLDLDPSLPRIVGDPGQLKQVFTNMIVNAKDAMEPKGGGTLTVATRRGEPGWVEVEISDTGVGIPPEHIPRLFDPFFTTKGDKGGTGLGLAVCHRIVSQHGGRIEVESEVDRGTTFKVILPVRGGREDEREGE